MILKLQDTEHRVNFCLPSVYLIKVQINRHPNQETVITEKKETNEQTLDIYVNFPTDFPLTFL